MTVSTDTSRVSYTGAGDTGPFAIPFYFLADADIRAITVLTADGTEDELELTTDFTLTGAGDQDGGELTLVESLSSDYKIIIFRDPEVLQETSWPEGDSFPAASHENAADRLIMIAQRLTSLLERAVRQPDGDVTDISALPAKVTRASKYLAFDAEGNPVATSGTEGSEIISTFSETLLDDTTAGDWLTTLGISAYIQTLLNDANAATARATLGFTGASGTVATANIEDGAVTAAKLEAGQKWTTGDVKLTLKTAADTGWVLMNDGTIGNASSGGTTRANADTEDLFTLLWTNTADADCPVSSGRGASAAADFAANKTITLPLTLGRALATYGSGSGLTARDLAETVGTETHQLTGAELAAHTHDDGTYSAQSDGAHTHTVDHNAGGTTGGGLPAFDANAIDNDATGTSNVSNIVNSGGTHTHGVSGSSGSTGDDTAHPNMQPTVFLNVMIKL